MTAKKSDYFWFSDYYMIFRWFSGSITIFIDFIFRLFNRIAYVYIYCRWTALNIITELILLSQMIFCDGPSWYKGESFTGFLNFWMFPVYFRSTTIKLFPVQRLLGRSILATVCFSWYAFTRHSGQISNLGYFRVWSFLIFVVYIFK